MSNLSTIRSSIATLVKTLDVSNGNAVTANAALVFTAFDAKQLNNKTDLADYPKFFIITDTGAFSPSTSGTFNRSVKMLLVAVLKFKDSTPETMADTIDLLLKDLNKLFADNNTLGGLVQDCYLGEFTTDSGLTHPEGILASWISIEEVQRDASQV